MIGNNNAIRNLMDNPLMIGRHRPIVAKWFQAWVEEYVFSRRISNDEDAEMAAIDLKAEILKEIESRISVVVEKCSLAEGWRRGTPYPSDSEIGKEVTVKFYGFRESADSK